MHILQSHSSTLTYRIAAQKRSHRMRYRGPPPPLPSGATGNIFVPSGCVAPPLPGSFGIAPGAPIAGAQAHTAPSHEHDTSSGGAVSEKSTPMTNSVWCIARCSSTLEAFMSQSDTHMSLRQQRWRVRHPPPPASASAAAAAATLTMTRTRSRRRRAESTSVAAPRMRAPANTAPASRASAGPTHGSSNSKQE
jgi:hypothetical protein